MSYGLKITSGLIGFFNIFGKDCIRVKECKRRGLWKRNLNGKCRWRNISFVEDGVRKSFLLNCSFYKTEEELK